MLSYKIFMHFCYCLCRNLAGFSRFVIIVAARVLVFIYEVTKGRYHRLLIRKLKFARMSPEPSLVNLPDEILLQVMSYLTTSDLLLLARTCRRLRGLLADRSLWRRVDLRQSRLRARQLSRLLRHLHSETRSVSLAGHVRRGRLPKAPLLTAHVLGDIKTMCQSLVELRLERCLMNARELPLDLLPESLLCLSLRGSEVTHRPPGRSYFYRLWELTPRLTELDLSMCGWLDSHALLPLSKLAQLQRLSFKDCRRMGGEVAYSSIACMLGFRALRALDVRRTQVADSDVSGFCQLPRIEEILLEPRVAGRLDGDAALRHLGQHRGAQLRRLAIRHCQLTDRSVTQIPQLLPELRQLDITGCSVPTEWRRWLSGKLTRCVVSCHEDKRDTGDDDSHAEPEQDPNPVPEPGQEPNPGPEPGQEQEPPRGRRRRRSPSPAGDGAPAAKRRRREHCQCVRCTGDSDGGGSEEEEEEEEWDEDVPDDLANQPGVIVLNLFDARQAVRVVNGDAQNGELEPADGVQGAREADAAVAGGEEGNAAVEEEGDVDDGPVAEDQGADEVGEPELAAEEVDRGEVAAVGLGGAEGRAVELGEVEEEAGPELAERPPRADL